MYTGRRDFVSSEHRPYFTINLYNSFNVIRDLFSTLFRVATILACLCPYSSIDLALLRLFDTLTRSIGMCIMVRTYFRAHHSAIISNKYLAQVRNFDTIVSMNDILAVSATYSSYSGKAARTTLVSPVQHTTSITRIYNDPSFMTIGSHEPSMSTALENAPFERGSSLAKPLNYRFRSSLVGTALPCLTRYQRIHRTGRYCRSQPSSFSSAYHRTRPRNPYL